MNDIPGDESFYRALNIDSAETAGISHCRFAWIPPVQYGETAFSELTHIQSNLLVSDLFFSVQACDFPSAGGAFLFGSCVWSVYLELASWPT